MTRVLIRHFFTNILPCKGSLQCTCRCSPPPKKTSFNWTRPYVRGGLRKMPTEMIRHIFTLMIWLKAPGSLSWRVQYVAARRWPGLYICTITKWWRKESIINRLKIILQTGSLFVNAKYWLKITVEYLHYIFCTWQFEALLASVSLFRKKIIFRCFKGWVTN